MAANNIPSTKPYLIRAIHEWCCDNGYTPYLLVKAGPSTRVPLEHVKDGQIVLNVSYDATGKLMMDNDAISFQARFGGVARDLFVPIGTVLAIYAKENGVGMGFEPDEQDPDGSPTEESLHDSESRNTPQDKARPKLQRIK